MENQPHKLSVLMPVHNQHYSLRRIVERVLSSPVGMDTELVIVDDGSEDWSVGKIVELARQYPNIKAVFHPETQGKGAAIRTAIEHMTGDVAIIQEPDLAYDPAQYPQLLDPIRRNVADAVFGSRMAASGLRRVLSLRRAQGIRFMTFLTNLLFNVNLTDAETPYKVFRADILKQTILRAKGPAVMLELAARMAQWNIRVVEVPISYARPTLKEEPSVTWGQRLEKIRVLFSTRFLRQQFTTHEGYYILTVHDRARKYNRWLLSRFRRYIGNRVLEAGSGIGTLTDYLTDRHRLVCLDYEPFYLRMLRLRFGPLENFRAEHFDLTELMAYDWLLQERFDTIICVNVLEHLRNDLGVLHKFDEILVPGGHLILLVPHSRSLMSPMDVSLGHYRRYERAELANLVNQAGFDVVDLFGFNRLGGLGWFVVNRLLGRKSHSAAQLRWFDRLMPIVKICEYLLPFKHVSLICVAHKREAVEQVVVDAGAQTPRELEEA
jgi:glycosyltransferase involved in cell wall biosynthesis